MLVKGKHQQHQHHLLMRFHFPHLIGHGEAAPTPKGWMTVKVGEEQQRFMVPLMYLNHPLFVGLLKEAEEEYGFEHDGAIAIPCKVDYFRQVQHAIDADNTRHHHHHHHDNHHHRPLVGCFKA